MRVLIVDDEPSIRRILQRLLEGKGHDVTCATDAESALRSCSQLAPDVILLDLQLPGRTGLELLPDLKRAVPAASIIMMTAYGSISSAVEAMREGARDYLTKPFDNDEMLARLERIEEVTRLREEVQELRSELETRYGLNELVGSSPHMAEVFKTIHKVAPFDASVVIHGESGTGKELVARAIHRISPRGHGPFVAINCGAIPDTLVEDTFFGHVRGAYTDAGRDRRGLLAEARGGTLFLDEIAELPLDSQATLLRALAERRFTPVGSDRSEPADLRVIAASNVPLDRAVTEHRFREDLFWRLNVVTIVVPPLRDRTEDIPALVDHLVTKWVAELGLPPRRLHPQALETLLRYAWPGNVRELENTLYRALVMAEGDEIRPGDLPARIRGPLGAATPAAGVGLEQRTLRRVMHGVVDHLEATVIRERLEQHGWNRTRTADSLGIGRKTLFNKMRRHGIEGPGDTTEGGPDA